MKEKHGYDHNKTLKTPISNGEYSVKGTDLPGFEPGLEAPEASVLSKLDYRPNNAFRIENW